MLSLNTLVVFDNFHRQKFVKIKTNHNHKNGIKISVDCRYTNN